MEDKIIVGTRGWNILDIEEDGKMLKRGKRKAGTFYRGWNKKIWAGKRKNCVYALSTN